MDGGVSLIGVLVAAVANMVVAALWYSPPLFGKAWLADVGASPEALRRAAGRGYVLAGLASLVAAFTLASSLSAFGMDGAGAGALLGLEYGIGIAAMYVLAIMAFEARTLRLIAIDIGFVVVGLATVGAVLGLL